MSESRFVVDQLLPLFEPHIISGPSGGGKSTLLLQTAYDWSRGEDVFGYRSFPAPFCVIACDRSQASLRDHMERLQIDPRDMPHFSMIGRTSDEDHTIESALRITRLGFVPQAQVLFLDGFASLCPGRLNDAKQVTQFLKKTTQFLQEERVTVIGTLCSAKAREGGGYLSPRDRIAGSASWCSNTDTKILIEPAHPHRIEDLNRIVYLAAQGLPARVLRYVLEGPRLVPCGEGLLLTPLDGWLGQQAPGARFTTADLLEVAEACGYGATTAKSWLRDQATLGTVVRVSFGKYQVSPVAQLQ